MDRVGRLLDKADRSQRILEIGPGYSPAAPKSAGWQTHVVDHAVRDELRAKYATAGVDTGLIEDVDTVWRGGSLHEAVPAELLGRVDLIIASHVLEHMPDLIGFLQSASHIVTPNGRISLALPDRRYCFDCFRPGTTTGGLLEAHLRRPDRHSLKTAFDHTAYSAAIGGQIAWGPRPVGEAVLLDPFAAAADLLRSFNDPPDEAYKDYHAWQFTPAGFQLAMFELGALGTLDWHVTMLHGPENFEFFAVLRRGAVAEADPARLQLRRRALLLAQLIETREQIDFMVGPAVESGCGPDRYSELVAKLSEQEGRLLEMADTLLMLRAVLNPCRRVWRSIRGKGRIGGASLD